MHPNKFPSKQPGQSHTKQKNIVEKLAAAIAMHQKGQLDQAVALYKEILRTEPRHFDALQLLATASAQQANFTDAVGLFDQALAVNPRHTVTLYNRGNVLRSLGRQEDALESYDKAIKGNPNYLDALYNRGNVLCDLSRPSEALGSYDRVLKINPLFPAAFNNRGNALRDLQDFEGALASYDMALKLKPDNADALSNRGHMLRKLGRHMQAMESYDRALSIKPDHVEALHNRGNALCDMKRYQEALRSYDLALKVRSNHAEALNGRGAALQALMRHQEALESFDLALQINSGHVEALGNRGNALRDLKRHQEALKSYQQALEIRPDFAETNLNEGLCRLSAGDWAAGWEKYEWRWKQPSTLYKPRGLAQPLWLGKEPLRGKTVLLHSEQGLGDTIQFCRYAKQVSDLGATVLLEVQSPLKNLLKELEGVAALFSPGEPLPHFDYHCPLLSLPLAFRTTESTISGSPYVWSGREKQTAWKSRLNQSGKKNVGLVWSGNVQDQNDQNRSISLDKFSALTDGPAAYYCLQKELRPQDQGLLAQTSNIHFFGETLEDFSDTAALIDLMDLVITVDTSVAHLAGAMGKPAWILLPFNSDWRWLLNRSDSPWYHSVKLFRQPTVGDWDTVLAQVELELSHCL